MTEGIGRNTVEAMRLPLVAVPAFLFTCLLCAAGEKDSDAAIKRKLLGYWQSPRHAYLIKADGVIYMCPRSICTTTNRWDVRGGTFFWDSAPHDILTLTEKKFAYRPQGNPGPTYTLTRISEKEAEE